MHLSSMCTTELQKKKVPILKTVGVTQTNEVSFWLPPAIFTISMTENQVNKQTSTAK